MDIAIHHAEVHELRLVYSIMQQAFAEYAGFLYPPSGALQEQEEDLHSMLSGQAGRAIIGRIGALPIASARYFVKRDYVYIGRISVLPDYRGRGIATSLLAFAELEAARLGKHEMQLEVRMSIPANIIMYEKLGYRIIEHIPYSVGTDVSVTMSKPLPPFQPE